jgi:hypothetical protein
MMKTGGIPDVQKYTAGIPEGFLLKRSNFCILPETHGDVSGE